MKRMRLLVAVATLAAFAAATTSASAQTGVATLTGESLVSCHGEPLTEGLVCGASETGPSSIRVTTRCTSATTGTMTWVASGIAAGPYPGTFTETGRVQFTNGVVTSLDANFHIDSAAAEVDGRKFIVAPAGLAICDSIGSSFFIVTFVVSPRYEAIIKPVAGGSYSDEGLSHLINNAVSGADPQIAEVETNQASMVENFVSDLASAVPLLPDAKEQCKDEGFLIFGVFKNQGDCVSFVSTHGKNEPGKNQPGSP